MTNLFTTVYFFFIYETSVSFYYICIFFSREKLLYMNELEKNKHNTHIFSLLIYIIFHLLDNEKIQFSNSDLKKQIQKNKRN